MIDGTRSIKKGGGSLSRSEPRSPAQGCFGLTDRFNRMYPLSIATKGDRSAAALLEAPQDEGKMHPDKSVEILIAEDSASQAEMLKGILEREGYRIVVASDGRQALALLRARRPTMVISDILMPEMTGYELCHRIKTDAETRDIPVILLTDLSNSTDVLEGLAWEADSFISKPYNREYLIAHVAQTLANRSRSGRKNNRIEVEISYAGKLRLLFVDPQRLVSLLISSYEAAVSRNTELVKMQGDLMALNRCLDDMVEQRTAALSVQVAEGKRREAELEAELARLRTLIDSSPKKILLRKKRSGEEP